MVSVVKGHCQAGWRLQKGSSNLDVHLQNNIYKHTQTFLLSLSIHRRHWPFYLVSKQHKVTGEFVLKCF